MLTGTMIKTWSEPGRSHCCHIIAWPLNAGVSARLSGGTSIQSFGPDLLLPGHAMAAGRCWSVCAS